MASVIFELASISAYVSLSLFTVKVPQIVKMCQARSGEGISVARVIFELAAISANVSLSVYSEGTSDCKDVSGPEWRGHQCG